MNQVPTERELFDQVMSLPEGADLGEFLEGACRGDRDLAERVLALVESSKAASQIFPDELPGVIPGAERAGDRIGNYCLVELLGEGAFGDVWLARQEVPMRREVAVKILKLGLDTEVIVRRFELERQALAMMDHPNIANIHDAGATASGRLFFVMEHLDGEALFEYADARKLSLDARLDLMRQVIAAVQHAHQKGIIHRDLKSSNIIVVEVDGKAVPKVIDFGIAKLVTPEADSQATVMPGSWGTPAFMSPEQLAGEQVDTRSDIFTLGVIFYQLLCGCEVPRGAEGKGAPGLPPSRCFGAAGEDDQTLAAGNRSSSPRALEKELAGELDWIVMKATEEERERRYGSAAEMGADLARFLKNEPILAAAPSLGYTLRKFVSRHWLLVAAASLVLLSLVGGLAVALHGLSEAKRQTLEADRQTEIALSQTDLARTSSDILLDSIADFDPADSVGRPTNKGLLDLIRANAERRAGSHPEVAIAIYKAIASAYEGFSFSKDAREMHRKAYDLSKTVHGPRHIETAKLARRLATLLPANEESFVLLNYALEVFREVWGEEDTRTLHTKTMIGYWHMKSMKKGRFEKALPWFEEVLEITLRHRGEQAYDRERAVVLRDLFKLTAKMEDHGKAVSFAQECYELHQILYEPGDFRRLRARRDVSRAKIWKEDFDGAIFDLRSLRKAITDHYDETHEQVAETDLLLGYCFRRKGEFDSAALYYKKSYEVFIETGGADSHDAFQVACSLIKLFKESGEPGKAVPYREYCYGLFSGETARFDEEPDQALEGMIFFYRTFVEVLGDSDKDALKMAKEIEVARRK